MMIEDSRMKLKHRVCSVLCYVILAIAAFCSIFPFYWMIVGATNHTNDIIRGKMTLGPAFLENLSRLLEVADLKQVLLNSLKITISTVVLSLLVTSMAAYGFEKYPSRIREKIYGIFILGMMIPFSAIMIPLFKMMSQVGLVDSAAAVVLPSITTTFLIFFFRQNFKLFPNALIEAARIDGASEMRIFFSMVIPSMKSTYAAAVIYAFMNSWNNYLWPLIILQSPENRTVTLMVSAVSAFTYRADYGLIMVAIVLVTIPTLIIFLTMQKQFVEGMVGAVK